MSYVSFKEMRARQKQFCMRRVGGGYVNIFIYPQEAFVDQAQWNELESGNIGLAYGVAWWQQDRQNLFPSDSFTKTVIVSHGMRKETEITIAVSLGVSYAGVSAELSTTFRSNITVSEETTQEDTLTFAGEEGKIKVVGTWQLTDVFQLVRVGPNGTYIPVDNYEITLTEASKGGAVEFILRAADGYLDTNFGLRGAISRRTRVDPDPTVFDDPSPPN